MIGMFQSIVNFFTFGNGDQPKMSRRQCEIEEYLAQSVDRIDLERREKELQRKGYYL